VGAVVVELPVESVVVELAVVDELPAAAGLAATALKVLETLVLAAAVPWVEVWYPKRSTRAVTVPIPARTMRRDDPPSRTVAGSCPASRRPVPRPAPCSLPCRGFCAG